MKGADQGLTLALLVAGVFLVDHVQSALAAHDLAVGATFFDRSSYFHGSLFVRGLIAAAIFLFIAEVDASSRKIVRTQLHAHFITRKDPYVVHPHFSRDRGDDLMPVFQFYPEHGVRQSL